MKPKEERLKELTPLQFEVTQHSATEPPFSGKYNEFDEDGLYVDIVSGEALFTSLDKFSAGCGWPSFSKPVGNNVLKEKLDTTHGMVRTEVRSRQADSHLGHVFADGPKDSGGMRYCINSAALRFIPFDELEKQGYGEYKHLF